MRAAIFSDHSSHFGFGVDRKMAGARSRTMTVEASGKLTCDILKKLIERCLSRASVKGIGGLLEFLAVQQALNIPGDGVGCHDERVVQRMDIFTGYRAVGMTK